MAVVTHVRVSQSPRSATGVRPVEPRPARGVPVHVDGRRPARLASAPYRATVRSCEPRSMTGSIAWLVAVGVVAFLVVLGIGWSMGGPDTGSVHARTVTVQVHQGESLWSVAQRMAPAADPAAEVAQIRQLNGLSAQSVVHPGQLLKVPSTSAVGTLQR